MLSPASVSTASAADRDDNIILAPHANTKAPQADVLKTTVLSKESVKDLSKVITDSLANAMSSYGVPRQDYHDGWDEYIQYYTDEEESADGIEQDEVLSDNDNLVGLNFSKSFVLLS